jgi:hypothetical protein
MALLAGTGQNPNPQQMNKMGRRWAIEKYCNQSGVLPIKPERTK